MGTNVCCGRVSMMRGFSGRWISRRNLSDRVTDLANVTFQAKLGTYLERQGSESQVAASWRKLRTLSFDVARTAAACRKCDLTTDMVKEFTDLQGVVGGLYARAQGERNEVATAIYDHYKPVSMDDSIPARGRPGAVAWRTNWTRSRVLSHRPDSHRIEGSVRAAAGGARRRQDPVRSAGCPFQLDDFVEHAGAARISARTHQLLFA